MSTRVYERGFSLIELLIVLVVVGILATLAIPSLMGARAAAQQASAVSTLRLMVSIEHQSWVQRGRYVRMSEINQFQNNSLGTMSGPLMGRQAFTFQTIPTSPTDLQLATQFTIAASGYEPDGTTLVQFMTDQSGVISQVSP